MMLMFFFFTGCLLVKLPFAVLMSEGLQVLLITSLHVLGYGLLLYLVLFPRPSKSNQPKKIETPKPERTRRSRLATRMSSIRCWSHLLLFVAAMIELIVVITIHLPPAGAAVAEDKEEAPPAILQNDRQNP